MLLWVDAWMSAGALSVMISSAIRVLPSRTRFSLIPARQRRRPAPLPPANIIAHVLPNRPFKSLLHSLSTVLTLKILKHGPVSLIIRRTSTFP